MLQRDDDLTAPVDEASAERVARAGLRYALLDAGDDRALDGWLRANARGFHAPAPDPAADASARRREQVRGRRMTGVWDGDAAEPVATCSSWRSPLTLPGPRPIDAWLISSVTVAPTHAGRGIARSLIEGELRTASALGIPIAALTVSESTLYGRYGFGIATEQASFEIDTARVTWTGPVGDEALTFVDAAEAADELARLHAAAVATTPGEIEVEAGFWRNETGADDPDGADTRARRFVRCREGDQTTGLVGYTLQRDADDFTKHTLKIDWLVAVTDAAAAALWRYVVRQPLVRTVTATERPADDPVRWMLGDYRAARVHLLDHHWLRILDVPAALEARVYGDSGCVVLDVRDDLGFAAGAFLLDVDEQGRASVRPEATVHRDGPGDGDAARVSRVELEVATLASLLLGGFSADALARAGRIRGTDDAAIARVDRLFRTSRAPSLSTWY